MLTWRYKRGRRDLASSRGRASLLWASASEPEFQVRVTWLVESRWKCARWGGRDRVPKFIIKFRVFNESTWVTSEAVSTSDSVQWPVRRHHQWRADRDWASEKWNNPPVLLVPAAACHSPVSYNGDNYAIEVSFQSLDVQLKSSRLKSVKKIYWQNDLFYNSCYSMAGRGSGV